ncbi:UNVERIFIED_ORG: transcriptional regulator [Clostridium botulinum]
MINTRKIKGRMAELGLTQQDIAKKLGIAKPTVSQKINNVRPMGLSEAEKMSVLLKIDINQFPVYFFYNPSCTMQQNTNEREVG